MTAQTSNNDSALDWLEDELSERGDRWTALGVVVDREDVTKDDAKGVVIDLERGSKEGGITVWSTGEAETIAGDLSGALEQRRIDLSAPTDLGIALDQLEAYLISEM